MAVQDFLGVGALRDVGAALGGSFVRLHIRAGDPLREGQWRQRAL
jgi:hypothetical protein